LAVLLSGSVAAASYTVWRRASAGTEWNLAKTSEAEELTAIVASPGRGQCASTKENCFSKGCCNVVGFRCFLTQYDQYGSPNARCMEKCEAGKDGICVQTQEIMNKVLQDVAATPKGSLYCFSVYTKDTGSTVQSFELEQLRIQYQRRISIFACNSWGVFSDTDVMLADGITFHKVQDVDGDFHFAKRKDTDEPGWVNTGLFYQVWRAVQWEKKWETADWVIKVDPDAVFVPSRLQRKLAYQPVPASGMYFENCKKVDYGFFGNLEVISNQAFKVLLDNMASCKKDPNIPWKVGIEGGKYGPMGEDLFAQACMDAHGVRREEAFDLTTDGACESYRPVGQEKNKKWKPTCAWTSTAAMHPFKRVDDYFKCYDETVAAFGL